MSVAAVEIVYQEPALVAAVSWLAQAALGPAAISLCTLAVAFFGLRMSTGHFHPGAGIKVILGCFILIGATTIAAALSELALSAYQ